MVPAGGGVGDNQIGKDARLCMGGKVRRRNGSGTCGSIAADPLAFPSLNPLDSFSKVPPFSGSVFFTLYVMI